MRTSIYSDKTDAPTEQLGVLESTELHWTVVDPQRRPQRGNSENTAGINLSRRKQER